MSWHGILRSDPALRLAGAALVAIAALCGRSLFGHGAIAVPDGIDDLLALILFVGATAGAALLALGAHLFDEVDLPPRWRRL